MKGCMPSTIKYLLIGINFIVMVIGLFVLGFSIYALVDNQGLDKLVEEGAELLGENVAFYLHSSAAIILIIFSSIVVLLSFLGCCGAWKENRFALFLYFGLLLVVFMGTAVGTTLLSSQYLDAIKNPLLKSMTKYDPNSKDVAVQDVNDAWDNLQTEFTCCGVDSYKDWANVTTVYPDIKDHLVPESCCSGLTELEREHCRTNPDDQIYLSRMGGCLANFQKSLEDNKGSILIASVTIISFLFVNLLVLFGFALCLMPNNEYERV